MALVGVAATLLPLTRSTKWWVRILDFPRVQVAALLGLAIVLIGLGTWSSGDELAVAGYSIWAVAAALCAFAFQTLRILPYSVFARKQIPRSRGREEKPGIRIVISNVLQTNRKFNALLELVERLEPDVLFVVECNDDWVKHLAPLHPAFPHRLLYPQDNGYGLALYSRHPLKKAQLRFIRDPEIPSIDMIVQVNGRAWVRCFGLHPAPPVPAYALETDQRDAELLMVAEEIREFQGPVLVFGDLNDVAWSPTTRLFRKVSRMLDPRIGRGQYNTFHAHWPLLRYPLDHIFASRHFRLIRLKCLPDIGSDHLPVLAEFAFDSLDPSDESLALEDSEATPQELEEAEERIAEANLKLDAELDEAAPRPPTLIVPQPPA